MGGASIGTVILNFLALIPQFLKWYLEMRQNMSKEELAEWVMQWTSAITAHKQAVTDEQRQAEIKRIGDLARRAISKKGQGLG